MTQNNSRKDFSYFIFYAVLLIILDVIRPSLAIPDEGRYGEVARWMMISGDWITPRLNGIPFFHKPPMLYWFEAFFFSIFGVHAWVGRLVPTLHAVIIGVALYCYAKRFLNIDIARRATLVLTTSVLFVGGAQYINCDMLVAAYITLTILAFSASLQLRGASARYLAWGGFASAALGLLSKGLIGVALPGLVLIIWLMWDGGFSRILKLPWFTGLALFLAISAPWFVLVVQHYANFLHYFFIEQQFTRYVGSSFNNAQPWFFYAACLVLFCFPWIIFLRWKKPDISEHYVSSWRLAWVWLLTILIFFSIPQSKLVGYIFPVIPALALLIGISGWNALRTSVKTNIAFSVGSLVYAALFFWITFSHHYKVSTSIRIESGLLAIGWLWLIYALWKTQKNLIKPILITLIGTALLINQFTMVVSDDKGTRNVANYIKSQTPNGEPQVIAYERYFMDLSFYLNLSKPYVVVNDWKSKSQVVEDDPTHELLDGLLFEKEASAVLMEKSDLHDLAESQPNAWLITMNPEKSKHKQNVKESNNASETQIAQDYVLAKEVDKFKLWRSRYLVK